jgi:hypothetical protein
MAAIGVLLLAILVWAWWFDRYRRRPRRGPGAIDDTRLEADRSTADRPRTHDFPHGGGSSFG